MDRIKKIFHKNSVRSYDLRLVLKGNRKETKTVEYSLDILHYPDSKLAFHLDVTFFQKSLMHFKLMQQCMLLKPGIINYSLNH